MCVIVIYARYRHNIKLITNFRIYLLSSDISTSSVIWHVKKLHNILTDWKFPTLFFGTATNLYKLCLRILESFTIVCIITKPIEMNQPDRKYGRVE